MRRKMPRSQVSAFMFSRPYKYREGEKELPGRREEQSSYKNQDGKRNTAA
jgi:hypothetical protein